MIDPITDYYANNARAQRAKARKEAAMKEIKVKVTLATEEGEVLDQFTVANPEEFFRKDANELAHDIKERLEGDTTTVIED